MNAEVVSPLTETANVVEENRIEAEELICRYEKAFQVDVSPLFRNVKFIRLFRCIETGYRFYYPLFLSGDDTFYKHFGRYDWYYLPWKWEHETCLRYIEEGNTVLEVGAANGNFLQGLKKFKKINGTGLELNTDVVRQAKESGNELINQSVEEHARLKPGSYDVVCSFQVLEHIANVKEVIKGMVQCLKPGGKLIISVPNNDSFIKDNPLPSAILNMPPHHMGLWNETALRSLCKLFPLDFIESKIEPLQVIHSDTYQYTLVKKILFNSSLLVRIYWKLRIYKAVRPLIKLFATRIIGHSILCVYSRKFETS